MTEYQTFKMSTEEGRRKVSDLNVTERVVIRKTFENGTPFVVDRMFIGSDKV